MSRDGIALYFIGGPDEGVSGVPAEDLTWHALGRVTWIARGAQGEPVDITDKDIDAYRDELAATRFYRKTAPAEPAEKSESKA